MQTSQIGRLQQGIHTG